VELLEIPQGWKITLGAGHVLLVDTLILMLCPNHRFARNAQEGGGATRLG
jgi:hypothetical protein